MLYIYTSFREEIWNDYKNGVNHLGNTKSFLENTSGAVPSKLKVGSRFIISESRLVLLYILYKLY